MVGGCFLFVGRDDVKSELGSAGSAGEWDNVTNVCHTCNEKHETLETETKTGVRHGAETAGVEIPPHIFHGDVQLFDACEQFVIVGLAL